MIFMFNHKIVESTDADPVDYSRQNNRRLRREKYRRLSTKIKALNSEFQINLPTITLGKANSMKSHFVCDLPQ